MSGPLGSSQWMYSSGGFYPYEIEQSLRLNDNDSAYLYRTPASAGNRKTWTWSGWVKRGNLGAYMGLFTVGNSTNHLRIALDSSDKLFIFQRTSSSVVLSLSLQAVLRDPSAWYHFVFEVDTTQAAALDRVKMYVNGVQITYTTATAPALNLDTQINNTLEHRLSRYEGTNAFYFDGYMAEVNFIDGTALDPTSFGEFKSGVWIPKEYTGSYGTNGFRLSFADSSNIGDDTSGNTNDWTANNLAATDVLLDSPTNNFATLSPLDNLGASMTLSEGNLKVVCSGGSGRSAYSSTYMSSGSWYVECTGVVNSIQIGGVNGSPYFRYQSGSYSNNGTTTSGKSTFTASDILAVAYNADNQTIEFFKNNASQGSTTFTAAANVDVNFAVNGTFSQTDTIITNFGQDSSFAGNKTAQGNTDDNGIGDFYYAPPSGYLALNTANLPEPTITPALDDVPADYFNTVLYTGNGLTQSITGVGFQPDWTWIKGRSGATDHALYDAVRGVQEQLESNQTGAETTEATGLTAFGADGFSVGALAQLNTITAIYVAWNWKAAGAGVSNTDGTITSTVSANQKAGFSIVSYTGTGANATVGHGLGVAPEMVIVKRRDTTADWPVYSQALCDISGQEYTLALNTTGAKDLSSNRFQGVAPTSSVFSVGTSVFINATSSTYIAYCFAEVEGYSKFGSYTGNGSTDGPFVWCGFRPSWLLIKRTDVSGDSWFVFDVARDTFNELDSWLVPNLSNAETVNTFADALSNGFKLRGSITAFNASGGTYIFAAFAEQPFKYSNAR